MRDALIRYRDEVTAHKRSKEMETKLIKYILSKSKFFYSYEIFKKYNQSIFVIVHIINILIKIFFSA